MFQFTTLLRVMLEACEPMGDGKREPEKFQSKYCLNCHDQLEARNSGLQITADALHKKTNICEIFTVKFRNLENMFEMFSTESSLPEDASFKGEIEMCMHLRRYILGSSTEIVADVCFPIVWWMKADWGN